MISSSNGKPAVVLGICRKFSFASHLGYDLPVRYGSGGGAERMGAWRSRWRQWEKVSGWTTAEASHQSNQRDNRTRAKRVAWVAKEKEVCQWLATCTFPYKTMTR
jgi:hypothetical protein